MKYQLALNIFKDFDTDYYQITIACNDPIQGMDEGGNLFFVNTIRLLYKCDYTIVINDAETILCRYKTERRIILDKLNSCKQDIEKAPDVQLTEEELKGGYVIRDGQYYGILGTGKMYVTAVPPKKGWTVSDDE